MGSHLINVPYGEIRREFKGRGGSRLGDATSIAYLFRYGAGGRYVFNIVFEPHIEGNAITLSIPENIEPSMDAEVIRYVNDRTNRDKLVKVLVNVVGE